MLSRPEGRAKKPGQGLFQIDFHIRFMLSAHGLSCVRGERRLFAKLDLAVEAGQWLHVRGENGAGKTSLLRLLAGLAHPAEGEVRWCGQSIHAADSIYRSKLLFFGHHGALKEDLSARENLSFAAAMDGAALPQAQALAALHRVGLRGREDLPIRVLSAGQKRRVMLARLATRNASLWVLDEPFTALDTKAVDLLATLITEHLAQGGMAVLTSHQTMPLPGGQVVQL
ncbi:MAG: cytochrome c biogenesis heme-transporting ATPase CcmA [Pseudomonadota bacterium]